MQPGFPTVAILKGLPLTLRVFARTGDDRTRDFTAKISSWTSTNPAVATIDNAGSAFAIGAGTTTIFPRRGALQTSTLLTVTFAEPPIFIIQPTDTGVSLAINSPAAPLIVRRGEFDE